MVPLNTGVLDEVMVPCFRGFQTLSDLRPLVSDSRVM